MLTKNSTENANLEDILKNIGLDTHEAKVYLAALSLGNTTVLQLSRVTDIKRTTLYGTIEALKKKGLMKIETHGFKKFFVAENPERLSVVLEEKVKEFKKNLPALDVLYSPKNAENVIAYHEGLQSVKSVYEDLLKSARPKDTYFVIGNDDQWFKLDPKFFEHFTNRRAKKKLDLKIILQDTKIAREHKKFERNFGEKIKLLPRNKSIDLNMVVTPDTLVLHQLNSPIHALTIKTKSIINFHKNLFEILWQSLS